MAWLQVHQSLKEHRKTLRLADLLDVPLAQAAGHVLFLWLWSLDSAPDGRFCDLTARNLARAADWTGDPEHFVKSLLAVGFIDKEEGGTLYIHDWQEYVGNLMERRAVNAQRQARFRDTKKQTRNALRNAQVDTSRNEEVTGQSREEKSREEKSSTCGAPAPRTRKPSMVKTPKVETPETEQRKALKAAFIRGMHWDDKRLTTDDWGQIVYAIKHMPDDLTPEEVDLAFDLYPSVVKGCMVTPPAIAKHFSTLMAEARRKGLRTRTDEPAQPEYAPEDLEPLPPLDDPPPTNGRVKPATPEEALAEYERLSTIGTPRRGWDA